MNPLLPVVRELVRRGHEVSWYTGSAFRAKLEEVGARHVPVRRAPDFFGRDSVAGFRAALDPRANDLRGLAAARFELKHLCYDVAALELEDLEAWLATQPADVVVADPTILGAFYTCERHRIPCAVVGISILGFRSRDTAPPPLGWWPRQGPIGRLRNRLLYALIDAVLMRPVVRHGDRVRQRLGLPPAGCGFFEAPVAASHLWLQPTTADFEYPRSDLPDHVRFIGPILPPGPARFEPPDWWPELGGARAVVLVTQGTVRSDPAELIVPTLHALEDDDVLVVATTAGGEIRERVPGNARIADFVPYHHLLPHVDVMVTNAGYGGVHFALAHGVPLVAAGRTEEKAEICARIAWCGAGIDLRSHSPRPRAIRRAVRRVLRESRYRERAREIGRGFAACDAVASAADALEALSPGAGPDRPARS